MPELPEVETIVRGLNENILGRKILDVWTDFEKIIKKPKNLEEFKKGIKAKKIEKIWRRGKNILIGLSGEKTLLVHQKLTGHLLLGKWKQEGERWKAKIPGPLTDDPANRFLHLILWLDDGKMLALSDLRKFAKVELWNRKELENSRDFRGLGPEPLEKDFALQKFRETLQQTQGRLRKGKIKQILMNQNVIAGIGNIYSDEILWAAKVHPYKDILELSESEIGEIYKAMRRILAKAIKLGGESFSDFRKLSGEKGYFDRERKVYRREGEKCRRCGATIKRIKIEGRSAHFCPKCQKLY